MTYACSEIIQYKLWFVTGWISMILPEGINSNQLSSQKS